MIAQSNTGGVDGGGGVVRRWEKGKFSSTRELGLLSDLRLTT